MGTWGSEPWGNDDAADWFAEVLEETRLREKWLEGIGSDPEDEHGVVRAAAWLFIQLGRVYVWPVEHLDNDLERTITALRAVRGAEEISEDDDLVTVISAEIVELEGRRQ